MGKVQRAAAEQSFKTKQFQIFQTQSTIVNPFKRQNDSKHYCQSFYKTKLLKASIASQKKMTQAS